MEFTKFEELETKVIALLNTNQELKVKNNELETIIERTELDLVSALEELEKMEKERTTVIEKIDLLLNRIG